MATQFQRRQSLCSNLLLYEPRTNAHINRGLCNAESARSNRALRELNKLIIASRHRNTDLRCSSPFLIGRFYGKSLFYRRCWRVRIERLKKLIAASKAIIEGLSARVIKIRRGKDEVVDKATQCNVQDRPSVPALLSASCSESVMPKYFGVVSKLLWPSQCWMVRTVTLFSCQRVAHIFRKRCKDLALHDLRCILWRRTT